MLDFNDILATPGYNLQQFYGTSGTTLLQWQTWRKPRGVSWVYMIGVGGGGGGSTGGRGASTTGGGGGGGGSGGQSTVLIPAQFLPDVLYVQTGFGGAGLTIIGSGGTGVAGNNGTPTYVALEPSTTLTSAVTLLVANGGSAGGAEASTGSPGGTGGTLATVGVMPLAGRGKYTLLAGQTGGTGGQRAGTAPTALAYPTTGLIVTGGQGGGAGGTTPTAGAGFAVVTNSLGQDFYPAISAGAVASGSTPAGRGSSGVIVRKNLLFTGGTGGGGSSSTTGGAAAGSGVGAPGCGGGGAGAINSVNTTQVTSGDGGPGFVIIISW